MITDKSIVDIFISDKYDQIYYENLAPALVNYVAWVIRQATDKGIKRLYFLARDGYSMYTIAKMLVKESQIDIELRYLYVSRIALRKAEYHLIGDKALDMICSNGIAVTAKSIMKRAGLSKEQAEEILRDIAPGDKGDELLDTAALIQLKARLKEHQDFLRYVDMQSRDCYQDVIGYLKQEGMFEQVKYATVDCGWIGTLQRSLMHLVDRGFDGFYFGLYQIPRDVDEKYYHPYYFGNTWGLSRKVYFANCLFEVMVSAPEGMTTGYRLISDRYEPIRDEAEEDHIKRQSRNAMLCLRYIDEYSYSMDKYTDNYMKKLEKKIKRLMGHPYIEEVKAMQTQRFSDDVYDDDKQQVVSTWDRDELRRQSFINKILIKSGISKEILHDSAWPEGSVVLSGRHTGYHLWQQRLYKYVMYIRMQVLKR